MSLGQPGTRIVKSDSEFSELRAQAHAAMMLAVAGDLFVTGALIIIALLGPLSVPIIIPVSFSLIYHLFTNAFSLPQDRQFVNSVGLILFVLSLLMSKPIWDVLGGRVLREVMQYIPQAVYETPIHMFVIFGAIAVAVYWLTRSMSLVFAIALIATSVRVVQTVQYEPVYTSLIIRARYIAVLLIIPWLISTAIVVIVTAKNMLFPYLDYNLKPFDLSDLLRVGLLGLFRVKPQQEEQEQAAQVLNEDGQVIRLEVQESKSFRYADIEITKELSNFAKALLGDSASFTVRDAQRFGLTRAEFEALRDVFIDRGWAIWKNGNRSQGVVLLASGKTVMSHIAET